MMNIKDRSGKKLSRAEIWRKVKNRINNIFLDFELMVLRIVGQVPSHVFRLFFYKLAGIRIGRGTRIHMWCNFFQPKNIKIGEDTIIGDHAFLDGRARLTIGNHVDIASSVMIYNSQHDINSLDFHAVEEEVRIDDYVFIGPRVIILPGVRIGKGAIVGAGAVVTKNVEPFSIVAGVSAVKIGERKNKNPSYKLGRARLFQ